MLYAEALRQVMNQALTAQKAKAEQEVGGMLPKIIRNLHVELDKSASEGKNSYSFCVDKYTRQSFLGFWRDTKSPQFRSVLTTHLQKWCLDNGLNCTRDSVAALCGETYLDISW